VWTLGAAGSRGERLGCRSDGGQDFGSCRPPSPLRASAENMRRPLCHPQGAKVTSPACKGRRDPGSSGSRWPSRPPSHRPHAGNSHSRRGPGWVTCESCAGLKLCPFCRWTEPGHGHDCGSGWLRTQGHPGLAARALGCGDGHLGHISQQDKGLFCSGEDPKELRPPRGASERARARARGAQRPWGRRGDAGGRGRTGSHRS
jgi:hypothetical protein